MAQASQDRADIVRPPLVYATGGISLGMLFCVSGFLIDMQVRAWIGHDVGVVQTFTSTTMHVFALSLPLVLGYVFLQFGKQKQLNDERLKQLGQFEKLLRDQAYHDEMTGLWNRTFLRRKLEEGLASREWEKRNASIYMLDLDRFKYINDTFGHQAGDAVLAEVANRIRSVCGELDLPVRLGGDEFVVVRFANDDEPPEAFAKSLIESIGKQIELNGSVVTPGVSVGSAAVETDGKTWSDVLVSADLALYVAKTVGTGTFQPYTSDIRSVHDADAKLSAELQMGLDRDEFTLHFQPIYSARSGRIKSIEALLRWQHPELGLLSPDKFIPLAERSRQIIPLGRWVLMNACAAASHWPNHIGVAVNLSPLQLEDLNFATVVADTLRTTGIAPDRLDLEITESVLLEPSPTVQLVIEHLRRLGVKITMDDFGTGFSSLSTLRRFRFDRLKIDRSFTQEIGNNETAEIVRTMVRLASVFDMETVLEGVETQQHAVFAKLEGLDEVQGYLYAKPMPGALLSAILSETSDEEPVAQQA